MGNRVVFLFKPKPQAYKVTKERWIAMPSLVEYRSAIIKPADKLSLVIAWDREDYLVEGQNNWMIHLLVLKLRSTMINYHHNLQLKKYNLKNLGNIQSNAILITADVVGFYHSIVHGCCVESLHEKLEERTNEKNQSTELVELILKKTFFEFDTQK